jgi:hypothetical protein
MTEIQTDIKAIKEALSNAKAEIKVIWKDAWAEYQFEQHQRNIDTLAIQAQLAIDELKQNPYYK